MKYAELKKRHEEELNAFPMAFAFSEKQFVEGMEKLGLDPSEKDKVYAIPGGGFMRKEDNQAFTDMFARHEQEMTEAMKNDQFKGDAIRYELGNHEYCITYSIEDTMRALSGYGITAEEIKAETAEYMRDYYAWEEAQEARAEAVTS